MAANMEKEVASPVIEPLLPTDSLDDASEANKKLSNQMCNETDDPQAHQRNYRKRSVSESPEKSPEISPSSLKRKRHSDHRDERRHRRRSHSRSRSRSRSPRRRRSSSPRNLIHMMDLGPEVNGHMGTLLKKVEKILENQERMLKNQERLLELVEQQQQQQQHQQTSGIKRLVNGVRGTIEQESVHSCKSELSFTPRLESVSHMTNETERDTNPEVLQSTPKEQSIAKSKISKSKKRLASSTKMELGDSTYDASMSGEESAVSQNGVSLDPNDGTVAISPMITALNSGSVNCDGSSGTVDESDINSDENDRTKVLLSLAERIQKTSCSIGNFSVNLVKVLFTKEEMLNKNCSGTRGKGALDSAKLDLVKFCAFKLYAVPEGEQDLIWKQKCVVSIDEYLRRGKRARVQNRTKEATGNVINLELSMVNLTASSEDIKNEKVVPESEHC
ncbi:PREDICTED: splicing regulatory glutamine/lysine-rich protein 1-like isoform X2 [Acropora digitifera]|nr:PREDICTED: splicing regulatory glutamine/lysine-rich protein 1-like isoform X2 [Acropora digitifera]